MKGARKLPHRPYCPFGRSPPRGPSPAVRRSSSLDHSVGRALSAFTGGSTRARHKMHDFSHTAQGAYQSTRKIGQDAAKGGIGVFRSGVIEAHAQNGDLRGIFFRSGQRCAVSEDPGDSGTEERIATHTPHRSRASIAEASRCATRRRHDRTPFQLLVTFI
jgi:hypothetical protein